MIDILQEVFLPSFHFVCNSPGLPGWKGLRLLSPTAADDTCSALSLSTAFDPASPPK